jgi:uncharacterized iron-regulated membrane protein
MNMLNKKITWRKQHKWLGIGMSFFMLMFCLFTILRLGSESVVIFAN